MKITFDLDDGDYRDLNAAIATYQRRNRWKDEQGGVLIPEGESDLLGAIIGEICRDWMEAGGELRQGGNT